MQDISQWQISDCYAYLLTNTSMELTEVADKPMWFSLYLFPALLLKQLATI